MTPTNDTKQAKAPNPNAEKRSKVRIDIDAFNNNPVIQIMNKIPQWTISDDDKRPQDAKYYLETGNVRLFKQEVQGDLSALVTLDALNADENLTYVNRAFRFDGNEYRENPIICIDVEKTAPEAMVQQFMRLPLHYAEYSKSGGFHILIEVPEHIITDDMRYLFNLAAFKDESGDFEIIFNRHFCTFTRKVINMRTPDFTTPDTADSQALKNFLNTIVKLDEDAARIRRQNQQHLQAETVHYDLDDLPHAVKSLSNIVPKDYIEYLEDIPTSDYNHDSSRYEYSLAVKLIGKMYQEIQAMQMKNPFLSTLLGKKPDELTVWDYAYAAHELLREIVEFRPKHEEFREGLQWLLYLCRDASVFVRGQREADEKVQ